MLQSDAVIVAARGIDNLSGGYGTVSVDPVAPPTPVGGGRVGDLLAVAVFALLARIFPSRTKGSLLSGLLLSSLHLRPPRSLGCCNLLPGGG